jgi:hypothetical protein
MAMMGGRFIASRMTDPIGCPGVTSAQMHRAQIEVGHLDHRFRDIKHAKLPRGRTMPINGDDAGIPLLTLDTECRT